MQQQTGLHLGGQEKLPPSQTAELSIPPESYRYLNNSQIPGHIYSNFRVRTQILVHTCILMSTHLQTSLHHPSVSFTIHYNWMSTVFEYFVKLLSLLEVLPSYLKIISTPVKQLWRAPILTTWGGRHWT